MKNKIKITCEFGLDNFNISSLSQRMTDRKIIWQENEKIRYYFFDFCQYAPGHWNYLRLKAFDDGRYFKTVRTWAKDNHGELRCQDEESISSLNELYDLLKSQKPILIIKDRQNYSGHFFGQNICLYFEDITTNKDNHCYFVGGEMEVSEETYKAEQLKLNDLLKEMLSGFQLKDDLSQISFMSPDGLVIVGKGIIG